MVSTSWDDVLRLYRAILRETGGEFGYVSEGTLRYILDALDHMKGDVFAKAAFAIHEIATKHPLVNGNKRLALALETCCSGEKATKLAGRLMER